jgi:hypothetical protein
VQGWFVFTSTTKHVSQFAGKHEQTLVVGHNVIRIVEKALGSIGETNRKEISVRALTTASFWMNDEVFDLQEPVKAKIPVGNLLGVEVVLNDAALKGR